MTVHELHSFSINSSDLLTKIAVSCRLLPEINKCLSLIPYWSKLNISEDSAVKLIKKQVFMIDAFPAAKGSVMHAFPSL